MINTKNSQQLRNKENILNLIKSIYKKFIADIICNGEKLILSP